MREKAGAKNKLPWPLRLFIWLFLAYLIYFLICVLVPPLFHKTAIAAASLEPACAGSERVLCVEDNYDALLWRLRLIESAEEEIILSTFDWRDDNSGQDMMAALLTAADRGIHVRILLDGLNSFLHLQGNVHFRALAASPNVEIKLYNPVNLLTPWTLNYRLHDKYLIVDDSAYLLGGRNTYDLFLGSYDDAYNIDREVLVWQEKPDENTSQAQLLSYFEEIWSLNSNRPLSPQTTDRLTQAQQQLRERGEALKEQYPEAYEAVDWADMTLPTEGILLLSNGCLPQNKAPQLWADLCALMEQGRDILIQTPYLICNQTMYDGLASVCAGADTAELMLNAPENGANPFGCSDYLNQQSKVLNCGLTVVEWMGGQSLHTKTVVIDENLCIVGSFNFDMRSAYLDTELMLVIDCPELNRQIRDSFQDMASQSQKVLSDGSTSLGEQCQLPQLSLGKTVLYQTLRVVLHPFRYLL